MRASSIAVLDSLTSPDAGFYAACGSPVEFGNPRAGGKLDSR